MINSILSFATKCDCNGHYSTADQIDNLVAEAETVAPLQANKAFYVLQYIAQRLPEVAAGVQDPQLKQELAVIINYINQNIK